MAFLLSPEFRLLYAVALSALIFGSAWRLARRWTDDSLRAAADAFLLFYLVQYLSICVPGMVGALHPATIALVALLLSSLMFAAGMRRRPASAQSPSMAIDGLSRATFIASLFFLLGYLGALIWHQRNLPVVSNDAITYHLPAAVQWLQTGRLGLYESWYYNPANSYSPLGGSAYIAWLIAPFGNDVFARFVAVGPLIFLWFAMLNLVRSLGASVSVASVLALSAVLVRPFVSQTVLAKDDLFVAAFFIYIVDAIAQLRRGTSTSDDQPLPPALAQTILLGIALGLLLATKFTVLMSLPLLMLMIDRSWTVKGIAIVLGIAILLAGPWYLRNLLLTGNPLYPTQVSLFGKTVLPGILDVARSDLLKTPASVWHILTGSYYAPPRLLAWIILTGWLAGSVCAVRARAFDPVTRTCVLGSILGIAIFIFSAPYGEMRFAYPAILLLIASAAVALRQLRALPALLFAAIIAILAALSAFHMIMTISFVATGVVLAGVAVGIDRLKLPRQLQLTGATLVLTALAMAVYVNWSAYIELGKTDSIESWAHPTAYPGPGEVWRYVRNEVPAGKTIAYANTYFTYPLLGYTFDHRLVYAPTRRGLEHFVDLPPIGHRVTGEQIVGEVFALLRQDPDREQWLRRLRDSGAEYLVVIKTDPSMPKETTGPPEFNLIAQSPEHFERLFDAKAGSVFKINW